MNFVRYIAIIVFACLGASTTQSSVFAAARPAAPVLAAPIHTPVTPEQEDDEKKPTGCLARTWARARTRMLKFFAKNPKAIDHVAKLTVLGAGVAGAAAGGLVAAPLCGISAAAGGLELGATLIFAYGGSLVAIKGIDVAIIKAKTGLNLLKAAQEQHRITSQIMINQEPDGRVGQALDQKTVTLIHVGAVFENLAIYHLIGSPIIKSLAPSIDGLSAGAATVYPIMGSIRQQDNNGGMLVVHDRFSTIFLAHLPLSAKMSFYELKKNITEHVTAHTDQFLPTIDLKEIDNHECPICLERFDLEVLEMLGSEIRTKALDKIVVLHTITSKDGTFSRHAMHRKCSPLFLHGTEEKCSFCPCAENLKFETYRLKPHVE